MVSPIAKNNLVCLYGFWISAFWPTLQFYITTAESRHMSFFSCQFSSFRNKFVYCGISGSLGGHLFYINDGWMVLGWDGYIWVV